MQRRDIRQVLILLAVTLLLAALSWVFRTPRLPLVPEPGLYAMDIRFPVLDVKTCLHAFESGETIFVDTRSEALVMVSIPGAFFVHRDSFDEDFRELRDFLFPEDALIFYGSTTLQESEAVAARFAERGYRVEGILLGGFPAWQEAGGEVSGE
ncbi:MAG: rhodanese-like domain-containing protein [Candidatus Krumholzibacteria bacterium]|jgi:rhodanese-related sulfurtransferase|nr:rhodanese-like domain-containing protein [Candidatus Krumholzibacteria bacterium]MDP6669656.1 rhodanese-like domain-containing protein [Candidatus Krumholzibacteria bacterium]MDP6797445.1 rhodanese-like domain-containing protein [Candidatus Krumholzibacteria bacterium]MDP7022150.1 rhodanese-like domain-containing protein [Candidatus Krumholzibacteria bacterium]